jgi:hypothetical protein
MEERVKIVTSQKPVKNTERWIYVYWRPAIAWQYFVVCLFDFIIFPASSFILTKYTGTYVAWDPLTLKESGFYHLSMAAIIGVAAWTRGQEKIRMIDAFGGSPYDPELEPVIPPYVETDTVTQTPVRRQPRMNKPK